MQDTSKFHLLFDPTDIDTSFQLIEEFPTYINTHRWFSSSDIKPFENKTRENVSVQTWIDSFLAHADKVQPIASLDYRPDMHQFFSDHPEYLL